MLAAWRGVAQAQDACCRPKQKAEPALNVPPEGFVADYPWLATQVNNEVGSLQFTVTEIGSDFVPTETRLIITHREQVIEHRSSIGIRLTEDYVRSRGYDPDVLRKQGVVIDPPAWQSSGASEPAEPNRR